MHDDVGAVLFAQLNLHHGRYEGHDDGDGDVEIVAMVGQRQRVVACARRYHTARPLLLHPQARLSVRILVVPV